MKDTEIKLDTAILAWNKGFTKRTNITQFLLQKWLREKHNIDVEPYLVLIDSNNNYKKQIIDKEYSFKIIQEGIPLFIISKHIYLKYEEALEIGLIEALKTIK